VEVDVAVAVAGVPTSLAICSHQLCCHGIAPPKTRTSKRIYLIVLSTAAVTVVFVWFLPPLLFLLLPLPQPLPLLLPPAHSTPAFRWHGLLFATTAAPQKFRLVGVMISMRAAEWQSQRQQTPTHPLIHPQPTHIPTDPARPTVRRSEEQDSAPSPAGHNSG